VDLHPGIVGDACRVCACRPAAFLPPPSPPLAYGHVALGYTTDARGRPAAVYTAVLLVCSFRAVSEARQRGITSDTKTRPWVFNIAFDAGCAAPV
jgi:hypothetical protein